MGVDGTPSHLHENTEGPFAQKKESERLSNFNITGFQKLWLRLFVALILVDKQALAWKGHECSTTFNVSLSNTQVTDTVRNFNDLTKENAMYCYFNIFKKNEMSNYGHYFHQVACPNGKTPFTISPLLLRLAIQSIIQGTSVTNWKGLSSRS